MFSYGSFGAVIDKNQSVEEKSMKSMDESERMEHETEEYNDNGVMQ